MSGFAFLILPRVIAMPRGLFGVNYMAGYFLL
ncbi:MAG: hypothetical protein JWR05_3610 [Mucilaginibacter sp.]|nr:hypothetical protein [Mucilaginibacter sp.]